MLRFMVGDNAYKVQVAPKPLSDYRGEPAMGLCHGDRRLIEISPECPHGERLPVLLHELRHAWVYHFPPSTGHSEDDANYYASMTHAIINQLMNQGGPAALLNLETLGLKGFKPSAFGGTLADLGLDRMTACATCQQRIAPGSIRTTLPRPHPTNGASVMDLAFHCPFCDHVQSWTEFVTPGGTPSGVCAQQPEFYSGDDAALFCLENPDKITHHPAS
ncbi:MAG: hypothetical protein AAGA29_05825 [Planctomycetota bacterium]